MTKHKKYDGLYKFLLLLTVLLGYFLYLSWTYNVATGGIVAALTWSFFVLCTPIADAGFLLDFPVRLITGIKMIWSELCVWGLAALINGSALYFTPESYDKTLLTTLLHKILITPWPYWTITFLSAIGTFFSVYMGDDIINTIKRSHSASGLGAAKKRMAVFAALMVVIFIVYYDLVKNLGIEKFL